MTKYGKVVITTDEKKYEISEKVFFRRERPELYHLNGTVTGVCVVISRLVSNIEFIDCNFVPLNKQKKKYLTLTSNCPIKIVNSNFEKLVDITIATNLNDVVIKNIETKDTARLTIQQSREVSLSDIKNLDLDFIAEKINVSKYTSMQDNNAVVLLANTINLENVFIKNTDTARITAKDILRWMNTKITANNLFVENLFNSYQLKNSSSIYMLDDEKVIELMTKNHLYMVFKRLNNIVKAKKQNVIEKRQEELKNTVDVEIENLRKQIAELENYKELTLSQIEDGMNEQKLSGYTKIKSIPKNKNTK